MRILITGAAGFIGCHLMSDLQNQGYDCIGVDNYYNAYRRSKLSLLRDSRRTNFDLKVEGHNLIYIREVESLFEEYQPNVVIHLAASVGVRDSLENPKHYILNNIEATQNIINCSEKYGVSKILYASTSSVYAGSSTTMPWNEEHTQIKHQLSPYGYTKYVNECQFKQSSLYNVGMRFFTVYGPWGRPDMALFKFADQLVAGEPLTVFGNNVMQRDFTYIDDIISGINILLENIIPGGEIYNIGRGSPRMLSEYIHHLSVALGIEPKIQVLDTPKSDPTSTWADTSKIWQLGYRPKVDIEEGVARFVEWYKGFYINNSPRTFSLV